MKSNDAEKAVVVQQEAQKEVIGGQEGTYPMIADVIRGMMEPVMNSIAKLLKNNTEAMEQIAASQQAMSNRITDLEKQMRLQTPMTSKQVQYLNDAIRDRARELLDKRGYADDKKAVTKLGNAIRKSVLSRYGVGSLRDIPRHEYQVALNQIGMWNVIITIRDVEKEAHKRSLEQIKGMLDHAIRKEKADDHADHFGTTDRPTAGVDGPQEITRDDN